jgi:DMSO/TMAO reductase YedYZ molybdopterin-dependent catalytic subunit
VIPFLDQPPEPPAEVVAAYGRLSALDWQELDSWITPNEDFFQVGHYDKPVLDPETWRLEIGGLVDRPRTFNLAEIKAIPRQEVLYTLECSGNQGFDWFAGGIGNAKWAGTPLAPILEEAGLRDGAKEVVFFGADAGEEEVRDIKMKLNFSRGMSVDEALDPAILLCYEMNGEALPHLNGYPVRLIAPGWYGIANVKWLVRIEVMNQRWAGRFMAKDYVTIREEPRGDGKTLWTLKTVDRSLLKSATAKVTEKNGGYRIYGAAWGAPIQRVEVRVDDGPWMEATLGEGKEHPHAWKFWHLDWPEPTAGVHTITSRAVDTAGNLQPALDDPLIKNKHTYWESNQQITRRVQIG